jgi:hypothetical protein
MSVNSGYRIQKSIISKMNHGLKIPAENKDTNRVKNCIIGFLNGGAIGAKYTNSEDKIALDKVQNMVSSDDHKTSSEAEVALALMKCLAKSNGKLNLDQILAHFNDVFKSITDLNSIQNQYNLAFKD